MKITTQDLNNIVYRLNVIAGTATEPYTKVANGYMPNPGNYHLCYAYGGVELQRMADTSASTTDILSTGYVTKKELYLAIRSFIAGMENK